MCDAPIDASDMGVEIGLRRVAYDFERVIEALHRARHSGVAFVAAFRCGRQAPQWTRQSSCVTPVGYGERGEVASR
jgi:hypothetical protein